MSLFDLAFKRSLLNCKITIIGDQVFTLENVNHVEYRIGDYVILRGDSSPDEDGTLRSRRIAVSPGIIEVESDYTESGFTLPHDKCTVNVEERGNNNLFTRYS